MNWITSLNRVTLIGIILLLNTLCLAVGANDELLQSPVPAKVLINQSVHFLTKTSFHFNRQAPQLCGQKLLSSETELICSFAKEGMQTISLKICDEAESFCKEEKFQLQVGDGATSGMDASAFDMDARGIKAIAPGFLENLDSALKLAKKEQKLIFLVFGAVWCPPCNQLSEGVFRESDFLKKAKRFVFVELDVDAQTNWTWREKFKIKNFPTLVVLTNEGEEIGRFVGGLSKPQLLSWLESMAKNGNKSIESLKNKLSKNAADTLRLAQWYFDTGEYQLSLDLAQTLQDWVAVELAQRARLKLSVSLESSKRVAEYIKVLDYYLPNKERKVSPNVIDWLSELNALDPASAAAYSQILPLWVRQLTTSKLLSAQGYTAGDIYEGAGLIEESMGKANEAKKYFAECANDFAKQGVASHLKVPRGSSEEQAFCLYKGGKTDEAQNLYKSLIAAYPKEFTFYYYYARCLFEEMAFLPADQQLDLAEEYAYGDNWLKWVVLKIKVKTALHDAKFAKNLTQTAITKVEASAQKTSSTKRLYAELKELNSQLEKKPH